MNCKSGYDGENTDVTLSCHSFRLNDQELTREWLKRLARKNFIPSKHTRICSLHFKLEDFIADLCHKQIRCKRKRNDVKLSKRYLKPDAVPSIFENLSDYFVCKNSLLS